MRRTDEHRTRKSGYLTNPVAFHQDSDGIGLQSAGIQCKADILSIRS
jgi:hypothetical protein